MSEHIWLGDALCPTRDAPVEGGFVDVDGEPFARIANVDAMPPFLMSVVCRGDVWLFVGSNGAFTAGRVSPEGAIFPYQTADKILRDPNSQGAMSVFLVRRGGKWRLWEPWQESGRVYRLRRNLFKHEYGTSVVFEEVNEDLGLTFRWSLAAGARYGLIRGCVLTNDSSEPVEVRYLDGWRRFIVPGVSKGMFEQLSYLAEGYMRHERVAGLPLGLFTLNAGISDHTEPCESLRVTSAWSLGHANPRFLLCERQVEAFRRGAEVTDEIEIRGETGAFLACDSVSLDAGAEHRWISAADKGLDHPALAVLEQDLREPQRLLQSVNDELAQSREDVRALIAGADGLQDTTDRSACAHHFANVLFNCLRGGTFAETAGLMKSDLRAYLQARNTDIVEKHAGWLDTLSEGVSLRELRQSAVGTGDPNLNRLVREYLPLTFSRRHGDPSRPWNWFSIHTEDTAGRPVFGYEGNWRDIFQNWEALGQSYPDALESMIAVFLNASTADGYNPYRITREGIDWEVMNPRDPWSNAGYWGDHQIIYLLRLLESAERFFPSRLSGSLRDETYCYARIPYEIAGFDAMLANPRRTIRFNEELHQHLVTRGAELGADGKLLADADGKTVLVSLAEKLLVPLLAKLSNLVPDGGIWLNTQRPEWNDANNALAGWGLSVVTVQYLRRYIVFLQTILDEAGDKPVSLSTPVAVFAERLTAILAGSTGTDDAERFKTLEALGRAGEAYRTEIYRNGLNGKKDVSISALNALVDAALTVVERTIQSNRRPDGLFHSYNVLHVDGKRAAVRHLYLMLEGQVAALSSGLLSPPEALDALKTLRASNLYCDKRKSYLLYPDRDLLPFRERNTLPDNAAEIAPYLADRVAGGDRTVVVPDVHGRWHFHADLTNASDLAARLAGFPAADRQAVLDLWEEVFRHSEFTGRSGTFFMFEGLGSIYWHMIAKLMLAVGECRSRAVAEGADADVLEGLLHAYEDIRAGLGYRKTPAEYGAFPTDPYSHSPAHRGAQQPGMTGQVKEEILSRWGELGIELKHGRLRFSPRQLSVEEFHTAPHRFEYRSIQGADEAWDMPADSLGFTYCQTPVCYRLAETAGIDVKYADGSAARVEGNALSPEDSASLFVRDGRIARLMVDVRKSDPRTTTR